MKNRGIMLIAVIVLVFIVASCGENTELKNTRTSETVSLDVSAASRESSSSSKTGTEKDNMSETSDTVSMEEHATSREGSSETGTEKENIPETTVPSTTASIDPIVGEKTSFKNLKVGEIGKKGDIYVGLQYVKVMSYLPEHYGKEEVSDDHEVIIAFFEYYNGSNSTKSFGEDDITCYVDGIQVGEVGSYVHPFVDGMEQYHSKIDAGCQLINIHDFEVPKGWSEIRFFYKSDCVWIVSQAETGTSDYQINSLFAVDDTKTLTNVDDIIYSEKYEIQYKGMDFYHYGNLQYYVIFKFRITNKDDEALNTNLTGYNMRIYWNNIFQGDASYTIDEKFDGHINVFDVDRIEAGRSSNIYVAFPVPENRGDFYMVYDDGFGSSHICGTVYIKIE